MLKDYFKFDIQLNKKTIIILLVLFFIINFFKGFFATRFGLPYWHNWDEPQIISTAINMVKNIDFNPHMFNYPSFYLYLQSVWFLIGFLIFKLTGNINSLSQIITYYNTGVRVDLYPAFFIHWGRILTLIIGSLSVLLVFFISKKLFKNNIISISSSLILIFSPGFTINSAFITVDIPAAFMVGLTFLLITYYLESDKKVFFILSGISGGLTMGTKYNSGIILLVFILAIFIKNFRYNDKKNNYKNLFKNIFSGILFLFIGFYASTPILLIEPGNVIGSAFSQLFIYGTSGNTGKGIPQAIIYLKYFFNFENFGPAPFILSMIGIVLSFLFYNKKNMIILLSFPILFFLLMSLQSLTFTRNMMPIFPFLSIYCGLGIYIIFCLILKIIFKNKIEVK
jgi:4-amino-4-deoxy-L-arabinose transferase-like glycosyltransferase